MKQLPLSLAWMSVVPKTFWAFLAFVVFLLIFGHTRQPTVPRAAPGFASPPRIIACIDTPVWARPGETALGAALTALEKHGLTFADAESDVCNETCTLVDTAEETSRTVSCSPGNIVLQLTDATLLANAEDHVAECLSGTNADGLRWAAILVPLEPEQLLDDASGLSRDYRAQLLAHELVHAVGYAHVEGPSILGRRIRFSPPVGHLMHPNTLEMGWTLDGLK